MSARIKSPAPAKGRGFGSTGSRRAPRSLDDSVARMSASQAGEPPPVTGPLPRASFETEDVDRGQAREAARG